MRKQPPQQPQQKPQSKAGKKQKNLYLSGQARQLLAVFSRNMGVSETAVIELLIREKATRDNVALPADQMLTAEETPHDPHDNH